MQRSHLGPTWHDLLQAKALKREVAESKRISRLVYLQYAVF